jgi:uncharacterized membrane protein YphA (DoxX/SURF4 family)
MICMEDSMAHRPVPAWVAFFCAFALAVFFLGAGVYKVMDPLGWATKVSQLKVPSVFAMPLTLLLGISEIFAGVLLVVPRFRRWGAWLTGLLLAAFMIYIGIHYNALRGEDCTCFPFLERAIGPAFFASDAAMLVLAALAGWLARPSSGFRPAAVVFGAICVFAGISYGVTMARVSGAEAPVSVTVNGRPYSLREGRVFLYFFDPECSHCFAAAKEMAGYSWNDVKIVAIPTRVPQFANQFLADTGLKAEVTSDFALLKEKFPFQDPPFGVAIENGRQRESFIYFDDKQPRAGLEKLGYIQ